MDNTNRELEGVRCVVNSCEYNKDGSKCVAKEIVVEPKNAKSSDDTDCSTFRPMH